MNDGSIMNTTDQSNETIDRMTQLFGAMSDPTRARMLLHLRDSEHRSGDLAEKLDMTASAVSHQLRWLRENNVVTSRRAGREVYYQLADACIAELIDVALHHIQEGEQQ